MQQFATGGILLASALKLSAEHHTIPGAPLIVESELGSLTGRYTPIEDFYIRNHFPIADPAAGSLVVEGEVEKPSKFTLGSFAAIAPRELGAVLECASAHNHSDQRRPLARLTPCGDSYPRASATCCALRSPHRRQRFFSQRPDGEGVQGWTMSAILNPTNGTHAARISMPITPITFGTAPVALCCSRRKTC
jgi:hypothetical protein